MRFNPRSFNVVIYGSAKEPWAQAPWFSAVRVDEAEGEAPRHRSMRRAHQELLVSGMVILLEFLHATEPLPAPLTTSQSSSMTSPDGIARAVSKFRFYIGLRGN